MLRIYCLQLCIDRRVILTPPWPFRPPTASRFCHHHLVISAQDVSGRSHTSRESFLESPSQDLHVDGKLLASIQVRLDFIGNCFGLLTPVY